MIIHRFAFTAIFATACLSPFICFAESIPPSEDVGVKVKTLWQAKDFEQLKMYIPSTQASYPDFLPAIMASAFYDLTFAGKLPSAKQKLMRIKNAVDNSPTQFSNTFKASLNIAIQGIEGEIQMNAKKGRTVAEVEASADPLAIRNFLDSIHQNHPIIDLLVSSPKVFLGN